MHVTEQQVLALAPDGPSAAAGKKLAAANHWSELGHSPDALWGYCQGSARYQVRVDRRNLGTSCSCPSRKFPCKHALGLLLLAACDADAIPEDEPPDWVADWIEKRRTREAKPADAGPSPAKQVDEKARTKRQSARESKVAAGVERLDVWLRDLVHSGLAGVERQPRAFWEEQAKRLVDAQAPGLARQVARLADIPGRGPDWPAKLLGELGRLRMLTHACSRLDDLPAPLRHDVRQLVGWTISAEELEAEGEAVEDEWAIFGQFLDEQDERLRTQRSWALGIKSGRMALILQFAPGMQPFPESLIAGMQQSAVLQFYPGAAAQRARIQTRLGEPAPIASRLPGMNRLEALLEERSDRLAMQPWQYSFGFVLRDITLTVDDGKWYVRDAVGDALPLAGRDHWKLLAVTGGQPFDILGEWIGDALLPLSYWHRDSYLAIPS